MDELRWFRVREHIDRLQEEAASQRLARSGLPAARARRVAASSPPARKAPIPRRVDRPCLEGDPC